MICLDENLIARFIQGRLAPAEQAQVEQHLDRCEACTSLLVFFGRAYNPHGDDVGEGMLPFREPPPSSRADRLPALGSTLGRYVTLHRLGAGGMGVVFAAQDPTLHRKVAIKLLRPDPLGGETTAQGRSRILREARAMAQLSHPHVVAVYDVGTLGDHVFIAMELIEGMSLTAWLAAASRPVDARLRVLRDAGRGLAAAHAAGIVHGDFKPDNVLIGYDGRVRVSDFGLAGAVAELEPRPAAEEGRAPSSLRTSTGGTLVYMAPEQLSLGTSGARSDQWSFFVTLYEAVYGRRPFEGDTPQQLLSAMTTTAPELPPSKEVPPWLRQTLARGLSVRPADRFPSMREALDALEATEARAAATQVRLHAVLQSVMWVIHLAATVFVVSVIARRTMVEGRIAAPSDGTLTAWDAAGAAYGLILLAWIPLGLVWIPVNVVGLVRRLPWARLSSQIYAWVSLPTCWGTPYGLYALWTLSRRPVIEHFREQAELVPELFPGNEASALRPASAHLRTNAVLQAALVAIHAGMWLLLAVLLVDHFVLRAGSSATASSAGSPETQLWEWWALATFCWAIVGLPWTVANAIGLRRERGWARVSTLLYAVVALPSCIGTPFALYAMWSLARGRRN